MSQAAGHEVTVSLRERKKLATRQRIVEVALRRFAERGYEATTVEEIAGDAEVSVTTFFRYFRTKDEVLFIDTDQRAPAFRAELEARPVQEPDLVAVHEALRLFHQREGADDDQRRLQRHKIVAEAPVLRGRAAEVSAQWRDEVAAGLAARRGIPSGAREVRLTAAIALTILTFAEDEWCALGGATGWDTALADAFDCFSTLATRAPSPGAAISDGRQ